MYSFVNKTIDNVHLGLTHKCILECPECARTHQRGPTNELLDWEKYQELLDMCNEFLLCGNWGDPIYYRELFSLCKYIKKQPGKKIRMHTNGSGKIYKWWHELGNILDHNDMVIFSIDGTLENSKKYRVKSNRISIVEAIHALSTINRPRLLWKHIVFSYNINTITTTIDQARELNFDSIEFQHGYTDNCPENSVSWSIDQLLQVIYNHYRYLEDITNMKIEDMLTVCVEQHPKCLTIDLKSIQNVLSYNE